MMRPPDKFGNILMRVILLNALYECIELLLVSKKSYSD
jgi:hypothetical protein